MTQETKAKLESSTAPPASTCLEPHCNEHDLTIFHSNSSASPSDQGISCFLQFRHQQSTCHAPQRIDESPWNSRRQACDWTTSHPSSAPGCHEGHEGFLTLPQGLHKGSLCSKWPSESWKLRKLWKKYEKIEQTPSKTPIIPACPVHSRLGQADDTLRVHLERQQCQTCRSFFDLTFRFLRLCLQC